MWMCQVARFKYPKYFEYLVVERMRGGNEDTTNDANASRICK